MAELNVKHRTLWAIDWAIIYFNSSHIATTPQIHRPFRQSSCIDSTLSIWRVCSGGKKKL